MAVMPYFEAMILFFACVAFACFYLACLAERPISDILFASSFICFLMAFVLFFIYKTGFA
jgi:hypothetical protein